MKAYTYVDRGRFEMLDKPEPKILKDTDAIVRITLSSICTSDLHIKHGSVPRAVKGITVGHEMVGIVEETGSAVKKVRKGDRVAVSVETFCGHCWFCEHGWVNNCTDENGGWTLGCRIDGGQTELVRVPYADSGLEIIPDSVSDREALFTGDILATGYWGAEISEIGPDDTVFIIGAGPTAVCTMECVKLKEPKRIIVSEPMGSRRDFVKKHYPYAEVVTPEEALEVVRRESDHGGADRVIECAGTPETFRMAVDAARPNAIITLIALYNEPQRLDLPQYYGKNLTWKAGGVDGSDSKAILKLLEERKIDLTPLITHTYHLAEIEEAYDLFENRRDDVIKVAIEP